MGSVTIIIKMAARINQRRLLSMMKSTLVDWYNRRSGDFLSQWRVKDPGGKGSCAGVASIKGSIDLICFVEQ